MILKITLKHLLSKPFSSLMTLMAVAAALTLLGSFWTVVENLERVRFQQRATSSAEAAPGITIFLDSRLNAKEVEDLKVKALEDKHFKSGEIVSAAEAMKSLEQQFGETLSKVFGDEGLPVTMKLHFADPSMPREELVTLLNKLRSIPGVLDVDDALTFSPVSESSMATRIFSWATGLLVVVFLVVALLVSHLIRLAFESLRSEIETMKVIGAPNHWILMPLVADGFFMGLAGAILSLATLTGIIEFFLPRFAHFLLPKGVAVAGLSLHSALILMALGVGASVIGALFTWPLVTRPPQEV